MPKQYTCVTTSASTKHLFPRVDKLFQLNIEKLQRHHKQKEHDKESEEEGNEKSTEVHVKTVPPPKS